MNKLASCPICDHSESALFLEGIDYSYTKEEFAIVECSSCHFRYTNPIPSSDKIGDYYKADNYISHTSSKKGFFEKVYHQVRKHTLKKKLQLVSKYAKSKSLMDIGCGTGDFLGFVNQQGWKVKGLEPSEDAREKAIQNHQVAVESTDELSNQTAESFDAISMWHVLEHVYNLNDDFAQFKRILKKEGHLFIAVPNCASYDAQHYQKEWAAYDLPIHLYHFRPNDINALAEKYDMKLVEMIPMKFDSYYVSMLSEKYQAGAEKLSVRHMFKGFFRGMKSNMKAKNGEYSSQIYVLTHK
jgi:2-polyprenyl-3-methyl-5-hydroxy-6-metoxy-1,4-benzoquinol methylase